MSNEIQIQSSLQVRNGKLDYRSNPTTFTADQSIGKGPTPGAITVGLNHTNVDLSQLVSPGVCRLMNLDSTNFVEVGIYDADGATFYPLLELLPGETYIVRLSRYIGKELIPGTGTGPADVAAVQLSLKATGSPCIVLVEAFER